MFLDVVSSIEYPNKCTISSSSFSFGDSISMYGKGQKLSLISISIKESLYL